jgi:hypothetical protein
MIFISRLNYTTVVACNLSKSGQQVWNQQLVDKLEWQRDVNLGKDV